MPTHYNVLFLCTGNSARSVMAEAILNHKGAVAFTAYSAGSHPTGAVRAEALRQLEAANLSTAGLRSKSWEEFSRPSSPRLDFVFTVCDNAANEVCPVWPGQPMTAHWGIPTLRPSKGRKSKWRKPSARPFFLLDRRISMFLSLPLSTLDRLSLKREIDGIDANELPPTCTPGG